MKLKQQITIIITSSHKNIAFLFFLDCFTLTKTSAWLLEGLGSVSGTSIQRPSYAYATIY